MEDENVIEPGLLRLFRLKEMAEATGISEWRMRALAMQGQRRPKMTEDEKRRIQAYVAKVSGEVLSR